MKISKIMTTSAKDIKNTNQKLNQNMSNPQVNQCSEQKSVSFLSGISFKGYSKIISGIQNGTSGLYSYNYNQNDLQKVFPEYKTNGIFYKHCANIYYAEIDEQINMIPKETDVVIAYVEPRAHGFNWIKNSCLNPQDYFTANYDLHIKYLSQLKNAVQNKYDSVASTLNNENRIYQFDDSARNDLKSYETKLYNIDQKRNCYYVLNDNIKQLSTCVNLKINYDKTQKNIVQQKKDIMNFNEKINDLTLKIVTEEAKYDKNINVANKSSNVELDEKTLNVILAIAEKDKAERGYIGKLKNELNYWQNMLKIRKQWLKDSLIYIEQVEKDENFVYAKEKIDYALKTMETIYKEHFPECMN